MGITHPFVSAVADEGDPDQIEPSDWNASHAIDDLDLSATTLRLPNDSTALDTDQGRLAWDPTTKLLKLYDTQRDRAMSTVGWTPVAWPTHFVHTTTYTSSLTLSANGESVLVPMVVAGHMLLQRARCKNNDTTLERTWEWRLYTQRLNNGNSGESLLDEVPGANGTETFTATAASGRASIASSAPVYLAPGIYWLAIRNSHASNNFLLGITTGPTTMFSTSFYNGTQASALGSTFETDSGTFTGRTAVADLPGVRLEGRVFGQTAQF